jgi:predicted lipoprotein with Yx(FWY)xxD motif
MRITIKSLVLASVGLMAVSGMAAADSAMEMAGGAGKILVNEKNMTLYTFDKDTAGTSACYDKCATNWPPLMAASGAMAKGKYSVVARTDGSMQWAYDGKPLYLWIKDTKAGDMTGDGVNGVWHVAKP